MRKLGLIGGMSWIATRSYYDQINTIYQRARGAPASAPMLIENLDFAGLAGLESDEDWARAAQTLIESAQRLEVAGAGMLVIAANSMHRVYREIEAAVNIPVLHIADCVGEAMAADGVKRAALIGTHNVAASAFYRRRLVAHGIDLLPPDPEDIEKVDAIVYGDLIAGRATRPAERILKTMITEKGQEGAQAIVLAATELELVVMVDANILPIYDSTRIHVRRATQWLLGTD
ncbi:MAG TPA: amino acid racemase [Paracoccaceae bacterium]|nr:amino acid racemase [Paracoccaceae bacterium]